MNVPEEILMISRTEYENLCRRIEEAWGSDITPAIRRSLDDGSYRLIDNMRQGILESLSPAIITTMIDGGMVSELRAVAEKCKARYALIDELLHIHQRHAA
jgi:hypothetical protein